MKDNNARILVIGAGVNGSVCAVHLHNHGVDVTLLARGERFNEISKQGIIIENPFSQKRSVTKLKVISELLPDDTYDYILVVVRRNQVPTLIPILAANDSPNVVFMNNNLLGPGEMIHVLGKQRVMMGFVFAGGKRDGNIIRAIGPTKLASTPFGETDGVITPRLKELIHIFNGAGLKARASKEIVDWLATHAIGVAVFGPMVMKYHTDIRALARSKDDLKLTVEALRETHSVLKALGHRVVPKSQYITVVLPRLIMVFLASLFLNSRLAEVGGAWHVQQAPDEMQALANDLREMVMKSGVSVPSIRRVLDMK